MANQRTYLVAPNFTFRPHSGPIALGNIIADPKRPHRVLTAVDHKALVGRYPRIEKVPEGNHNISKGTGSGVSAAVWAQFLQNVNAKLSGGRTSGGGIKYDMEGLDTEYFVSDPTDAEIRARIADPKVQAVLKPKNSLKGKPIFMVNGVKIAKGLVVKSDEDKRVSAAVGASGTEPTGNIGAGMDLSMARETSNAEESHSMVEVVFAYQLLVIKYDWWDRARVTVDEYRPRTGFLGMEEQGRAAAVVAANDNDTAGQILTRAVTSDDIGDEGVLVTQVEVADEGLHLTIISFLGDS